MKGDIPAPALRLRECAVRVVTHERRLVTHIQGSKAPPPIIIEHRRYDSVMDASRKLGMHRNRIRAMLKTGEAQYV